MSDKFLSALTAMRKWLRLAVGELASRTGVGFSILVLAALLYLGPHFSSTQSCLGGMMQELIDTGSTDWQCFGDVLDDLRKDGTAATVILAIAAAILASAWSSGSRTEE